MSKKPNILLIHYNADSVGGGAERIVALVEYFSGKSNTLKLLLPGPGKLEKRLRVTDIEIEYYSLHENENPITYLLHCLKFCWYLLRQRINLIVFLDWSWWKPAEVLAAKLCLVKTAAIVAFYRKESAQAGFLRLLDKILPNSEDTAKYMHEAGLSEKTVVIHNFIDSSKYECAESIRDQLYAGEGPLLAYVGALHPIKGIEYLLEAIPVLLQSFPTLHLLIVGSEKEPGWENSLKYSAEQLGIRKHVKFLGQREDIPQIMNSIDLLIVPSLEEPFGFVNIEAGAAGTAVLAARTGGIPEIITHGETGVLVESANSAAIADATTKLLSNPDIRKNLGKALQIRVKEYFCKERAFAQWDSVCRSLFGKRFS